MKHINWSGINKIERFRITAVLIKSVIMIDSAGDTYVYAEGRSTVLNERDDAGATNAVGVSADIRVEYAGDGTSLVLWRILYRCSPAKDARLARRVVEADS